MAASEDARKRGGNGRLILGLIAGLLAGLAGGSRLLQQMEASGERADGPPAPGAGPVDQLKRRWQDAMAEGKVAAAEREAELEQQFAAAVKRRPAIEGDAPRRI